jgi:predicted nucleic acid-binding protein
MNLVYWDTMLFVYWLEKDPAHFRAVSNLLDRMETREDRLCTSLFTVGEILVGPYRKNQEEQALKIKAVFRQPAVSVLPFTAATVERSARIRAAHRITPADAIHLASAAEAEVDLFVTNDRHLHGLVIPGIRFITGMDLRIT